MFCLEQIPILDLDAILAEQIKKPITKFKSNNYMLPIETVLHSREILNFLCDNGLTEGGANENLLIILEHKRSIVLKLLIHGEVVSVNVDRDHDYNISFTDQYGKEYKFWLNLM